MTKQEELKIEIKELETTITVEKAQMNTIKHYLDLLDVNLSDAQMNIDKNYEQLKKCERRLLELN